MAQTNMTRPASFPSAQRPTAAPPNLGGGARLASPAYNPMSGQRLGIARPANARPAPSMSPGGAIEEGGFGAPGAQSPSGSGPLPSGGGGANMSASGSQSPPGTAGSAGAYAGGGTVQGFAMGGMTSGPNWGSNGADFINDPSQGASINASQPNWGSNGADFVDAHPAGSIDDPGSIKEGPYLGAGFIDDPGALGEGIPNTQAAHFSGMPWYAQATGEAQGPPSQGFADGGDVPDSGDLSAPKQGPDFDGAFAKVKAALQYGRQKSGLLSPQTSGGTSKGFSQDFAAPTQELKQPAPSQFQPQKANTVTGFADGGAIDPTGGSDMDNPMNAGPGAAPTPPPQGGAQGSPGSPVGYAMGNDAVPPDQAQALEASIYPHQQMDPSERKLLAVAAAPDQSSQWGMLQAQRQKFNSYQAFAKTALQGSGGKPPDLAAATKAATQAYQNVPDGNSVQFAPHQSGGVAVNIKKLVNRNAQSQQGQSQKGYDDGGIVDNDSDADATTLPINGGNPPLPTAAPLAKDTGPPTSDEESAAPAPAAPAPAAPAPAAQGVIPTEASLSDVPGVGAVPNGNTLTPSEVKAIQKVISTTDFGKYISGNAGSFDNTMDTGSDKVIQSLPDFISQFNKTNKTNYSVGSYPSDPSEISSQINNPKGIPSGANGNQVAGSSPAPTSGRSGGGGDSNLPLLHMSPSGQGNTLDLREQGGGGKPYNPNIRGGDSADNMAAKMAATLGQGSSLGGAAAGQFDKIPASAGGGPANRQQDTAEIDPAIIRQAKFLFPRMDQAQQARNYIAGRMSAAAEQQSKLDVAKNTHYYSSQAIAQGRENAAATTGQSRENVAKTAGNAKLGAAGVYADAKKYDAQMKASVAKDPSSVAKWNVIHGAIASANAAGTPMTDDQVQTLMGRIGVSAAPAQAAPAAAGGQAAPSGDTSGASQTPQIFPGGPFAGKPVIKVNGKWQLVS